MVTKWDSRFLELATLISSWSKDPSTKVGAVIVAPDRSVVAVGYNGFPRKMYDSDELYADRETKLSRIVHAEINAIIQSNGPVRGCTLYTTPFIPCDRCAIQVIQANIERVVSPKPSDKALSRWAAAFELTRSYFKEAGVELLEC